MGTVLAVAVVLGVSVVVGGVLLGWRVLVFWRRVRGSRDRGEGAGGPGQGVGRTFCSDSLLLKMVEELERTME